MELRELAERVLFGVSLSEKLLAPESVSDRAPGVPRVAPPAPGRPHGLRLTDPGRPTLLAPPLARLEGERARGELLHRFANHELLALELMALILLRFPDAPPAFRLGLAHTLREEQEHLGLYLGRMQELGVTFGELPLSGFFWNALSGVESPLAFVTAMSLTFEQANLDYAVETARALEGVGDEVTAGILWRVHDEEIGHVRLGYEWFERWRPGGVEPWVDYCRALPAPLTPGRAKGRVFACEARRAAGIDEGFLRELRLHTGSKGRVPDVFAFTPTCEEDLAQGRARDPLPEAVVEQTADLAPLGVFAARPGDVVLVPRLPSLGYREHLVEQGVVLPELVLEDAASLRRLAARKLGRIEPWGWAPRSLARLAPLLPQAGSWPTSGLEALRAVASKGTAAELLGAWLAEHGGEGICATEVVGVALRSEAEVLERARALVAAGHRWAALKAPFGTSGRGAQRVGSEGPTEPQRGWIRRTLAVQGSLVVEPWLDALADLSCQLRVDEDEERVRLTQFMTDGRGQYVGHLLSPSGKLLGLEAETLRAVHQGSPNLLVRMKEAARFAAQRLGALGYVGPLGVDGLLYRDLCGQVRLKPIVELNPRRTMGTVALGLLPLLAPGRVGLWRHVSRAEWARAGHASAAALAATLPPPQTAREPRRLSGGVLCTNDPSQATQRLTLLSVGATLEECRAPLAGL